jgi:hypothetical protein
MRILPQEHILGSALREFLLFLLLLWVQGLVQTADILAVAVALLHMLTIFRLLRELAIPWWLALLL